MLQSYESESSKNLQSNSISTNNSEHVPKKPRKTRAYQTSESDMLDLGANDTGGVINDPMLESVDSDTRRPNFDHALDEDDEEFGATNEENLDRQQMLEFAKRLQAKDAEKTKKFINVNESRISEEEQKSRDLQIEREKSRIAYLKRREQEKLEDLKEQIREEEDFFRGERLTKKELVNLEVNKKILDLAEEFKDVQVFDVGLKKLMLKICMSIPLIRAVKL